MSGSACGVLVESQPSSELLDHLVERAGEVGEAWGDAVPAATRKKSASKVIHRLHAAGLIHAREAA